MRLTEIKTYEQSKDQLWTEVKDQVWDRTNFKILVLIYKKSKKRVGDYLFDQFYNDIKRQLTDNK